MLNKSIIQLSTDLKNRKYSCEELTQFVLKRCKKINKLINCFITISEEEAIKQAKIADQLIAENKHTCLTGIPIAHKDNFYTANIKTSCGSKMLDNFIAPYDATTVNNLQNAGCILIGKTNMDEFSMGSSNEKSYYGATKNPWHLDKVPGGSSGGSAAAVAGRLVCGATGTDSGGSVRQPAAFSGITGIKPTYGLISRYGIMPFAPSLDNVGIFAKTTEDAAILLQAISGYDAKDSASVNLPVPNYSLTLRNSIKGLKIGLPDEYFTAGLNTGVALVLDEAITQLEKLGAIVKKISLPNSKLAASVYHIISAVECSTNFKNFAEKHHINNCNEMQNCNKKLGEEVKRRIMLGTYIRSSAEYNSYYLQAQKIRRLVSNDFQIALQNVDIILGPTTPTPAFNLNEKDRDPVSMYLSDIYTIAANLAGLPAMSVPIGFAEDLPVGMQLIGNYFNESLLLNIAHKYQLETPWHVQIPEGFE